MSAPFRVVLPLTAFLLLVNNAVCDVHAAPRPNIVVIMCDDLGYADVGFNGSRDIRTPTLDNLARNGTVVTSGYVCHPFCGPSRMGLMTGRYPHAFGGPFNLPNTGVGIQEYNKLGIPKNETLISSVLQQAGYLTAAVGKWHLGTAADYHPNRRGFDDFYGFLGGGHKYFPADYVPIYERQKRAGITVFNDYIAPLEHNGKLVTETEYMTDALSREAVRVVRQAKERAEPFFLYLAYNAPHTPLEAKADDLALYENIADKTRRTYAAMVHAVDRGVGQVCNALRETKQFDSTLIIFLSDNGGKTSAGANNFPLSKGKGSVFEGGVRVPMFWHWPDQLKGGQKYEHPVTTLDFYPTLTELAGANVPKGKQLDGCNVWPALKEGNAPNRLSPLYALRHRSGISDVAIRSGRWKAVRFGGPKLGWKLFDLDQDVGETKDLSAAHPEHVRALVQQGQKWSRTHTPPAWFDSVKARDTWSKSGMPNYDVTFELDP